MFDMLQLVVQMGKTPDIVKEENLVTRKLSLPKLNDKLKHVGHQAEACQTLS